MYTYKKKYIYIHIQIQIHIHICIYIYIYIYVYTYICIYIIYINMYIYICIYIYISFLLALLTWSVIPFGDNMVLIDLNVSVLFFFAISSLGVLMLIITAGWSSNYQLFCKK